MIRFVYLLIGAVLGYLTRIIQVRGEHYRFIDTPHQQVEVNENLRRQNEYLAALHETTLALMNRLDLKEVLEALLLRAMALVGTPHGILYLPEPGDEVLSAQVCRGLFEAYVGFRLLPNDTEGVTGKAWHSGQTVTVNNYKTWSGRPSDQQLWVIHAATAVPLRSGKRVLGVIGLAHIEPDRKFGADEIEILNRLAELGSVALDNARLYTESQQEVAERKRAEGELRELNTALDQRVRERTAELQQERILLQTILDDMGEGVVYSKGLRIVYVNQALAALTGYRPDELVGQPDATLLEDGILTERAWQFLISQEPNVAWRGETRFRRKDGSLFDAALAVTSIVEPAHDATGMIAIVRDVTQEKQLQAQKSRFIANASHELRTPLTSIKTRLYLLRKQPEQVAEHAAGLERAADHMIELVEHMLDISRFERGVIVLDKQMIDLHTLIENAVHLQQPEAAEKNIALVADLPAEPVQISADPVRITQVILNLIVNAINYTKPGGQISVQLRQVEQTGKTRALIAVQDTGSGIAPEHLLRIFEPFFRATEGAGRGTGLGLSIAKDIVELHGGTLTVESQVGAGSTFSVQLALPEESA